MSKTQSRVESSSGNVLAQNFTPLSLLRFALPTMTMMLFMGLYTIVDTIFVARFVDEYALSAINIVCPVVNLTVGFGTMLATGGNAILSRQMGSGRNQEAKESFSLLILAGCLAGVCIAIGGLCWLKPLIYRLGASDLLYPYCRDYLRVFLCFVPANILQTLFQNFFVTAGKPGLGLTTAVIAGVANIVFDYVFIVLADRGIAGAALGTGIGYVLPGLVGLWYFVQQTRVKPASNLCFCKLRRSEHGWRVQRRILWESCCNGLSEMVNQSATAVTTLLFNRVMMSLAGETGVAAITILIYTQFLLSTLYIGYSMGVAPVIGYNYGKKDTQQQKAILRICARFIRLLSIGVFLLCRLGGRFLIALFVAHDSNVYQLSVDGFAIFSYSFLFCGWNIFTSARFTALSNGKISAILSLLRTFGLVTTGLLFLPQIGGMMGVWLAVPLAEGIVFVISLVCVWYYPKRQGYRE